MNSKSVFALVGAIAMLVVAPIADAAQRYASPTGIETGTCPQSEPCALKKAVEGAMNGDEVIVLAGNYTLAMAVGPMGTDVDIHGDLSGPMPLIARSSPGAVLYATQTGTRIRYLQLVNTGVAPVGTTCTSGGLVERVVVVLTGMNAKGIEQEATCTVRDSLIRVNGSAATAIDASSGFVGSTETGVVRNVTAIATGTGSMGLRSVHDGFIAGSYTTDLKNVIASGEAADLATVEGGISQGKITVSNSNFDIAKPGGGSATITEGAGNQKAAPLFVDATNGDYREAVGSPTIDAGVADQVGTLDLAGNARVIGSAPDIGAYEYVPPPPPPAPVATLQSLSLKPKAFKTVNAGGALISKKGGPVGTTVSYFLAASGTVDFSVERKTTGRKVGKKCKPRTAKNKNGKKCALYKTLKASFSHTGAAGSNSFKFSGRLNNKALPKGNYRLVGVSGGAVKSAPFTILP